MPHDIWQLRQEWEAQPGTGNLLQTGLYIAEKTKKQSLAMDEESCLSLQQECSWRARSTQVSSCLPLPFKVPERTNKPKLAALPMGGEACPSGFDVGEAFPVQQLSPSSWGLLTGQSLLEAQEGYGLVSRGVGWPGLKSTAQVELTWIPC